MDKMKHFSSFFLVFFFICAMGVHEEIYSNNIASTKTCQCMYACTCDPISEAPIPCTKAYNAPLQFASCWGGFVSASYLYWSACMQALDIGIVTTANSGSFLPVDAKFIKFSPGYHSTFKILAGIHIPHDGWQTYSEYTRFHKQHTKNKSLGPDDLGEILPFWTQMNQFTSASGSWTIEMDLIDWCLARHYYVGQFFSLKPFFGLRGMLLDQTLDISYLGPSNFFSNYKSTSWAIGPRGGINSWWAFCGNFRLFANTSLGLVFQNFTVKTCQTSEDVINGSDLQQIRIDFKEKLKQSCFDVHFSLGVGYEEYFFYDRGHFNISLGYDILDFFNQNVFRQYQTSTDNYILYGDLFLQGLTLTLLIDF